MEKEKERWHVGALRSGEIVIGKHVTPDTMTLDTGDLPEEQARELVARFAEHRDCRMFVPGVDRAPSDLEAMKSVARFNSHLFEARVGPERAREYYEDVRREGVETKDEDMNPEQKWSVLANKGEQMHEQGTPEEAWERFQERQRGEDHDKEPER
jgi:hypothetical protein